ncbi:MAG TPA: MBL fold metallo-hydrolase [Candidatus Koribacter sp.]|jgi:phosphoribosyl 1,2-cyclic phosphodiesterase
MAVSITVLASGSRGNSTVVTSSQTRLLVDAGLSCKETLLRLAKAECDACALDAILITHEHSDHIAGLNVLAKKLRIPVFITASTLRAYLKSAHDSQGNKVNLERVENFESGRSFQIGDIAIMPFTIPHDAADPVGFTFRAEGIKAAIATDLGYMPVSVKDHIRGCQMLVVESNHDVEMLRVGPYPWSVKQRVLSRLGHLSNDALADFIVNDYDGAAEYLILAHLSEQNNHPEVARTAAERALDRHGNLFGNKLMLARQDQPLQTVTL